jgi:hypothetical protein
MAGHTTEPRDLRPRLEADAPLRRLREDAPGEASPIHDRKTGLSARPAAVLCRGAGKTNRVFFFTMVAIIAAAIAIFLILHPQPGN